MKIKWIGQSGYILKDGKTEICIDPYLSDVVNRVASRPRMVDACIKPQELKCDFMVCTHDHLDHIDIDAIPLMNKENMLFLAPSDAKEKLLSLGVTNYLEFDEGAVVKAGDFELTAVYANHTASAIGVIVRHGGTTLYFSGDTYYDEKLEKIKDFSIDVMFICINGKLGNMDADDAAKLTRIISPKVGVPTHYGMFESNTEDPKKYTDKIDCGFIMEYGKEYTLSEVLNYV